MAFLSSFFSFQKEPPTNAATVLSNMDKNTRIGIKTMEMIPLKNVSPFHGRVAFRLALRYAFFLTFASCFVSLITKSSQFISCL